MLDVTSPTSLFDMASPFAGATFDAKHDTLRLARQAYLVWTLMADGCWRTLREISEATACPEASVSARLRDFRKDSWGCNQVDRRRRGEPSRGCFEYRLTPTAGVRVTLDERTEQGHEQV